jgi:hypothetical protein
MIESGGPTAMKDVTTGLDQAVVCDISDEALETMTAIEKAGGVHFLFLHRFRFCPGP